MKITRAYVSELAQQKGWEPVQLDGIPEGFSWKEADVTIGKEHHRGNYIAFAPLRTPEIGSKLVATTKEELLNLYNQFTAQWPLK